MIQRFIAISFIVIVSFVTHAVNPFAIFLDEMAQTPEELSSIVAYPFNESEKTIKVGGIMLGLIATDYYTTKYIVQDMIEPAFDFPYPKVNLIEPFSDPENVLVAGVGSLYLTALLTQNEKGQRATWMTAKAFLHSYLITHVGLKTMFARQRPNRQLGASMSAPPRTDNPFEFGDFHEIYWLSSADGTAFPSFHITLAFSSATVLGNVYQSPLVYHAVWMILTLPDFKGHNHWTSDMVMGAIVGSLIGHKITEDYMAEVATPPKAGDLTLKPLLNYGLVGLNVRYHF